MAAPTWVFISFMVLLCLAICSAQPISVHTIKAKEVHHDNFKAHTLSNIDAKSFGGGFGVPGYSPGCGCVCPVNNPSGEITELKISGLSHSTGPYRCRRGPNMRVNKDFNQELLLHFLPTVQDKHENKQEHLGYGGSRRFGIGRDGGRVGGGSVAPEYDIQGPGYGSNPGFGCPPGCGYVCPANKPSEGMTEFHISGLSQFTGPYRCRADVYDTKDYNELLLHFVYPRHGRHENQYEYGHPVERSEEEEAGHWSEHHTDEDIIN
ncbi:hypothetical protein HAX54_042313 [Datura stramonium]|uniref:Uncharacterized protein n=1 Tax=Datura stramonium TaxID=4076 RepID=A0ABS8W0W7_DATST|nr:hypothetical protein [Datura stramonium]